MSNPSVNHLIGLHRVRRERMMKAAAARLTLCILCILLVACDVPTPQLQDSTPRLPNPSTATPTPGNANADSGWQPLFVGAEVRRNLGNATRLALRLDPAAVTFAVAFNANPNQMQTVGAWLSAQAALAAVNCGFYLTTDSGENRHIGLLAGPDGVLSPLRSGWGGVLLVRGKKASLVIAPGSVSGDLRLGLQGWPMLVRSGRLAPGLNDSDAAARTAAAVDSQGRILFIADVTSSTLAEFARFLAASDMQIAQAVNLDGGSSTGLRYRATLNDPAAGYDSFFVPCAVLIKPLR
jgi:hypothetical protein